MRKPRASLLVPAVIGLLVALGLLLLGALFAVKGIGWAADISSIAGFFVAVVAFVSPILGDRMHEALKDCMSAQDQIEAFNSFKERELAKAEEIVPTSNTLTVCWKITPNAQRAVLGAQQDQSDQLGGNFDEVRKVFLKLEEPRRIVFLGDAGAGKTVLVNQLIKGLLEPGSPPADERIPFRVSATTWDSGKDMMGWLADELIRDDPKLERKSGPNTGIRVADDWAKHKILPVIDGLDELSSQLRIEAINKISNYEKRPVVVTSRSAEYIGAVEAERNTISGAKVVELLPLDIDKATKYLSKATKKTPERRWREVFTEVNQAKEGPLARVLTNPLMLWLTSVVYYPKETSPRELTDSSRFSDQESIEGHLLNSFVPAIYARNPAPQRYHWSPKQAQRWLASLAYYMERDHSTDLAWWRLTRAVRGWRPIGVAVRAVLLFGVAWWLAVLVLQRLHEWLEFRRQLLAGPFGDRVIPLATYIREIYITPKYNSYEARSTERAIVGFFPWHSLALLEIWVAVLGLSTGVWFVVRERWWRFALLTVKIRSARNFRWFIGRCVGTALMFILPYIILGAVIHHDRHPIPIWIHIYSSARILLPIVILWMWAYELINFIDPLDLSRSVSPAQLLRIDRGATVFMILPKRAMRALLLWLFLGPLIALAYSVYAGAAFLCRIVLGGSYSQSDRFADARAWLVLRRRIPWRVMDFLSDAKKRGVLRRSGIVYEFRHLRLRQLLATQHPRLSRLLTSGAVRTIRSYNGPLSDSVRRLVGKWSPKSTAAWSQPFWAFRFQEFASQPHGETSLLIGRPASQISDEGIGYAQSFGGPGKDQSWVICARPGEIPTLVAGPVWQALRDTASQALQSTGRQGSGQALRAVGFPTEAIIHADATDVPLAGGSWGAGTLIRDDSRKGWHFEPPRAMSCPSGVAPRSNRPQLLVGAYAEWYITFPHPAIRDEAFQALPGKLAESALSRAITELWVHRGAAPPVIKWQNNGTSYSRDRSVSWIIVGARKKGKQVVEAEASFSLRKHMGRPRWAHVLARASLRIHDSAAWLNSMRDKGVQLPDENARLSPSEVADFLSAAWYTAAEVLPTLIIDDPIALRPLDYMAPSITLH